MIGAGIRAQVVAGLLGQPYDDVSRHCWWLAGVVQREVFGRDLPGWEGPLPSLPLRASVIREHPERRRWIEHPEPADGDLVLMGRAPEQEVHCGVYLGDRGVIHCSDPHGVVIDTVTELRAAYGWRHLSFNRPA